MIILTAVYTQFADPVSAAFSVIIATCLAFNSQNIKKTFEGPYIRATKMLPQTASNGLDFQKFEGYFQQVRLA